MAAAIAAFRAGNAPHILQVFEVGTATMMVGQGRDQAGLRGDGARPARSSTRRPTSRRSPATTRHARARCCRSRSTARRRCSTTTRTRSRRRASIPNQPPQTWPEVVAAAAKLKVSGAGVRLHDRLAVVGAARELQRLAQRAVRAPSRTASPASTPKLHVQRAAARRGTSTNLQRLVEEGLLHLRRPHERGRGQVLQRRVRDADVVVGRATANIKQQRQVQVRRSSPLPYYADVAGRAAEHDHRRRVAVGDGAARSRRTSTRAWPSSSRSCRDPKVQAEWHQATGYLPITMAAYELTKKSGFYEKNPGTDVSVQQMIIKTPTANSQGPALRQLRADPRRDRGGVRGRARAARRTPRRRSTRRSSAATR